MCARLHACLHMHACTHTHTHACMARISLCLTHLQRECMRMRQRASRCASVCGERGECACARTQRSVLCCVALCYEIKAIYRTETQQQSETQAILHRHTHTPTPSMALSLRCRGPNGQYTLSGACVCVCVEQERTCACTHTPCVRASTDTHACTHTYTCRHTHARIHARKHARARAHMQARARHTHSTLLPFTPSSFAGIDSTMLLSDFLTILAEKTGVAQSRQEILAGFPPKVLEASQFSGCTHSRTLFPVLCLMLPHAQHACSCSNTRLLSLCSLLHYKQIPVSHAYTIEQHACSNTRLLSLCSHSCITSTQIPAEHASTPLSSLPIQSGDTIVVRERSGAAEAEAPAVSVRVFVSVNSLLIC